MWHIFWDAVAWIVLFSIVLSSIATLVSIFKNKHEFSDAIFSLLFYLFVAFLLYSHLFPEKRVEVQSSANNTSRNSFHNNGSSYGDSWPKSVPDQSQVEDTGTSGDFGNEGVSGYDATSYGEFQEVEPASAPLDITPVQSPEQDTLTAHYFYPEGEGNGYFEIKPGDRIETVAGDKINMDLDIPYEDMPNVTVNDEQVEIMPAVTNPNVSWYSFIAAVGDNEVKVSVSGYTYGFLFIGS